MIVQMSLCVLVLLLLAGSDYNSTTRILTFNSNHTRIPVQVPIVQDQFTELTEQFRASLSLVNDNGINVNVTPDQATVNIIDDDSKCKEGVYISHYGETFRPQVLLLGSLKIWLQ